jgi:hypothetical protein
MGVFEELGLRESEEVEGEEREERNREGCVPPEIYTHFREFQSTFGARCSILV